MNAEQLAKCYLVLLSPDQGEPLYCRTFQLALATAREYGLDADRILPPAAVNRTPRVHDAAVEPVLPIPGQSPAPRRALNRGPDGDACVYKPSFTCYHEDAEE